MLLECSQYRQMPKSFWKMELGHSNIWSCPGIIYEYGIMYWLLGYLLYDYIGLAEQESV